MPSIFNSSEGGMMRCAQTTFVKANKDIISMFTAIFFMSF